MDHIDYNILNDSLYYYSSNGFTYVEVPWMVDDNISDITKPTERKNFYIDNKKVLVASGEQSFMQMINDSKLNHGRYVTLTPCFRDETMDEIHKQYFMKTELIVYDKIDTLEKIFLEVMNICIVFYKKYANIKLLHNPSNIVLEMNDRSSIVDFINRLQEKNKNSSLDDFYNFDIIEHITSRELGSYGIRTENINGNIVSWIYATGCAEPRLSSTIRCIKKSGYHNSIIPKHEVGTFYKILEEVEELKDAKLSGNKIMELVEISDILGAIEMYTKKKYNISLQDLDVMNKTTQRAFINGRR